jgi:hypothetical protein
MAEAKAVGSSLIDSRICRLKPISNDVILPLICGFEPTRKPESRRRSGLWPRKNTGNEGKLQCDTS